MSRLYARALRILALQEVDWPDSNRIFLATFIGGLAAIYAFILVVDPYGVAPYSPLFGRPIVSSTTKRQMYPQILRSGRYDSLVVGTSTSKLLDPAALGPVLGGHFANLAMAGAAAWEQVQVIDLFRRRVAAPKAVLVGLDHEWCDRNGDSVARESQFPSWAFDDNPWNDLFYLLNSPTVEVAGLAAGGVLGMAPKQARDDGFETFLPPESAYDLARARDHIAHASSVPRAPGADRPAPDVSERERQAMEFEALPWLDEALARLPDATRKVLVFMPVHAAAMPARGSYGAAWEAECKRRTAAIARRRGALLVDWRIPSPLTTDDSHYWDPLHFRLPIAYQLIEDLDGIVKEGRESPDGSYRILAR
jgi:hypothetical protein